MRGRSALSFFVMSERVAARASAVAPLLLFVAALAAACSLGGVCTMIGCISGESLDMALPVPLGELESGQVSGCRNDHCWHGEIAVLDDWSPGTGQQIDLEPDFAEGLPGVDAVAIIMRESNDSFSLRFEWQFEDYRAVKRGDTLRVSVQSAAGGEIASAAGSVTSFSDWYPNGEDCDETPCRSGHVDVR
jgi:hypothetical protein